MGHPTRFTFGNATQQGAFNNFCLDTSDTSTCQVAERLCSSPTKTEDDGDNAQASLACNPVKRISFNRKVRVRCIPSRRDYSRKESRCIWYSEKEMRRNQKKAITIVKKMVKGMDVDQDQHSTDCSRGLECLTPARNRARQERKFMILSSVLMEQETQYAESNMRSDGFILDDEAVARVYKAHSRDCIDEAVIRAKQDFCDRVSI